MLNNFQQSRERAYNLVDSCIFRKTHERFGGLSNMASGFPIMINETTIYSSEALYQACRFPHLPDVQELILEPKSAMTAKMKSKPHRKNSRTDWEHNKIKIMQWCLRVKLAQNFLSFGLALEETYGKNIVEHSDRDVFWGAKLQDNKETLVGVNALGRLLMELREQYCSVNRFQLLIVNPPIIDNFLLLGKTVPIIDMRNMFIEQFLFNNNYQEKPKELIPTDGSIAKNSKKKSIKQKVQIKNESLNSSTETLFDPNEY